MDVETEILELKRRVGDLEGAVNVLAGQISQIGPGIASFRQTAGERFDGVEGLMSRVVSRLDTLNTQVWSLRDDLPELISQAVSRSRSTG